MLRRGSRPDVTLVKRAGSERIARAANDTTSIGKNRQADVFEIGGEKLRRPADARDPRQACLQRLEVRPLSSTGSNLYGIAPAELHDLRGTFPFQGRKAAARADRTRRRGASALEGPPREEAPLPDLQRQNPS